MRCEVGHVAGAGLVGDGGTITLQADVAQLVERNLAKVEVAGSIPVVRSTGGPVPPVFSATWPSGKARVCKTLYPGSIPGVASTCTNVGSSR